MRRMITLGVTHVFAVASGVGMGLSIQDDYWLLLLFFLLLLCLTALNVQSLLLDHVEREDLRADLISNKIETTPAPRRDADIIRETYGDGKVTLQHPSGASVTGTQQQIDGLGSEMERRQRGEGPQFKQGEQVDW